MESCLNKSVVGSSYDFRICFSICENMVTVFPGTAIVESDFSGLQWERKTLAFGLADLSLEGIMQAKQYEAI